MGLFGTIFAITGLILSIIVSCWMLFQLNASTKIWVCYILSLVFVMVETIISGIENN